MLDSTLQFCLLVQGFWSKSSWGFPKGKVNEEEAAADCAIREVLEETGFDITSYFNIDDFIDNKMNGQLSRLYIVPGVSMKTNFQPRTRKEIKNLDWFRIDQLPAHKKDMVCKQVFGLNPNSFFMVIPFIKHLRKWISQKLGLPGMTEAEYNAQKPSDVRAAKFKDSLAEPRVVSERHRLKLQQAFSQDMQAEYMENLKLKDPRLKGRDQRTKSASPPPRQKTGGRNPSDSPKSTGKKLTKKDSSAQQASSRRSLATQFADGNQMTTNIAGYNQSSQNRSFFSSSWQHFRLDVDAVLTAMFPSGS